jgi:hypothetical protein
MVRPYFKKDSYRFNEVTAINAPDSCVITSRIVSPEKSPGVAVVALLFIVIGKILTPPFGLHVISTQSK